MSSFKVCVGDQSNLRPEISGDQSNLGPEVSTNGAQMQQPGATPQDNRLTDPVAPKPGDKTRTVRVNSEIRTQFRSVGVRRIFAVARSINIPLLSSE
jgi:hypothetical protein